MINVEDMDIHSSNSADETQVYREIEKELGIQIVRMEYKPKQMILEKYAADKVQKKAQIFYEYQGEVIWYSIYLNAEDSSLGQKETDEIVDEFTVENSKKRDPGDRISVMVMRSIDLLQNLRIMECIISCGECVKGRI